MTMPEPYSYLVVYHLGGEAKTFWALEKQYREHGVNLEGYKGQILYLTYSTPMCVKEKPRTETPKYVIAAVEGCEPQEVQKPA